MAVSRQFAKNRENECGIIIARQPRAAAAARRRSPIHSNRNNLTSLKERIAIPSAFVAFCLLSVPVNGGALFVANKRNRG